MRNTNLKVEKYQEHFRPVFPQQHVEAPGELWGARIGTATILNSQENHSNIQHTPQSTIVSSGPNFLVKESVRSFVLPGVL